MSRLPPSFKSLYRLFLRASSASVLHHNAARKQHRRLFRPVFDAAAKVVGKLQRNRLSRSERIGCEQFLNTFQQRMDGTLSLLLNSAQHRGIPHQAIYNMNRLQKAHAIWIHGKYYFGSKNAWDSKATVTGNSKPRVRSRDIDRMEKNRMHERCWDAFGEVVRMAEGRHTLSLGRLYLRPWTLEKR
ncbi:hypothetical protein JVT61DRAFT_700 [Boletus reticuloceps]|uniref:Uncharacterized protein n=1 Tax=Boletus reticuloceps TaxID=495285 RepID=A0A8I2Z221_9AGAM|nr:hypothetical protein JVT61DRAFT_700 [Boletus reticuloceps]